LKILILGSEGFIGSHLVDFYLSMNYSVYGCDLVEIADRKYNYKRCSILSLDFEEFIKHTRFDICINCSGSGNVAFSFQNPYEDFKANVSSVYRVLLYLSIYQPSCKYIHFSSAAVYGNSTHLPISESNNLSPQSPYGYHKLLSENICSEFRKLYNLPILIVRPFSVYGDSLKKQVLWDTCSKLLSQDSIQVSGTGDESRDFIHIKDVVRIIDLLILHSKFDGDIYNIGNGEEVTIKFLMSLIVSHFHNKEITFSNEVRVGDPLNWKADITKIMSLKYLKTISIEEGVSNYIHWFKKFSKL
jgi:UDP-glucose 4-epimerase